MSLPSIHKRRLHVTVSLPNQEPQTFVVPSAITNHLTAASVALQRSGLIKRISAIEQVKIASFSYHELPKGFTGDATAFVKKIQPLGEPVYLKAEELLNLIKPKR